MDVMYSTVIMVMIFFSPHGKYLLLLACSIPNMETIPFFRFVMSSASNVVNGVTLTQTER